MDEKELIKQAIQDLSKPEPNVEIGSIKGSSDWKVKVTDIDICTITEVEKTSLMAPLQDYAKFDPATQRQMVADMYADMKEFLERRLAVINDN